MANSGTLHSGNMPGTSLEICFDWSISNTSLRIIHWFKVYSAHAILYDAKCRV